ncbi:hypothetical protein FQN55_003080 [Onygenales sp. PD_40]|nr:hypothetical protein FQN55_003080 [Onygenales sp. PD_40]KAK2785452.1 hypothetical protein FQN53_007713 [Emmonsiellopsis sp. PD_33]KAK2794306.1 hypothetical protein FQN52_008664 [Onygenales sp. PD_12]
MDCFGYFIQLVKSFHQRPQKASKRPVIGPPTDFRRVDFTLPLYDKEDAVSDDTPSDTDTLCKVSRREKLKYEALRLRAKMTGNMDANRFRPLSQRT